MFGRRYSEGLHQAIEAKENVRVQHELCHRHGHLPELLPHLQEAGRHDRCMAKTEENEFRKIYGLTWCRSHQPADDPRRSFRRGS